MKRFAEIVDERRPMFNVLADVLEELPDWLAAARTMRRLTLAEAGEQIGISQQAVWSFELRKRGCSGQTALLILRWLGKP